MSDDGEQTTVDNLMKNVLSNLIVAVEVNETNSTKKELPINMKFTVTNGSSGLPNVVFENIELTVGIPPNVHVEKIDRISGGQSYEYTHKCSYTEMPLVQYDLKGNVIPSELFKFETQSRVASPTKPGLSAESYIKAVNELDVFKWENAIPSIVLIPDINTTIAELKGQGTKLGEVIMEVRNEEKVLQDLSRFLNLSLSNPMREKILKHRNLVNEYLKEVETGVSSLRALYRGQPDARIIGNTLNKVISRLSRIAAQVTDAAGNLY